MNWRAKEELYEEILREYEFGVGTIRGIARKLGVHRRMIELLALGKQHGYDRLRGAVETALSLACWDVAAVQYLLSTEASAHPPQEVLEVGRLRCYERPLPAMSEYDRLLSVEGVL